MGILIGKPLLLTFLLILGFATMGPAQVPQVKHVIIVLGGNTDYADVNNTSLATWLCRSCIVTS